MHRNVWNESRQMRDTMRLPALEDLKSQAKRLRDALAKQGNIINHAQALELIASQFGFRDWNTLHAKLGNQPPQPVLSLGDQTSGRYLGKPFNGKVVALQRLTSGPGMTRVTFDFDEPVNVSKFDSFSVLRRRVVCTLAEDGRTVEKTSDGEPHMELERFSPGRVS